ncbi:adenosine receptor A2b-like [Saccoglossus kowalevskii]|uniref:Alpha-1B adrenergic receptor-like n=1 Tax=Saccoglossus kowalevskii TaxID=10224 RepID=A0ABM0GPG6_SACKO|nr:PREDICTED: alpha-1B adrenergic receptor-like [Saccoglossus kowalevskii]
MADNMNNTAAVGQASHIATVIHCTILSTLLVLIIAGNGLMIYAILSTSRLRITTNYFIVSLAISDMLVGLVVIPINFAFPTALLKGYTTCLQVACFTVVVCTSSITNIVAVTIDRYLAITSPLKYHAIMTSRRAIVTISLVWVYAFTIGFLPVMGWREKASTCQRGEVYAPGYAVFLFITGLVFPVAISTVLYCRILKEANRQTMRIQQIECRVSQVITANEHNHNRQEICPCEVQENGSNHDKHNPHSEHCNFNRKAFRTVMYILMYFELSWIPLFVTLLIDAFVSPLVIHLEVRTFTSLLALGNSVMDPIIYGYFNRDLRNRLKEIVSKMCRCFHRADLMQT